MPSSVGGRERVALMATVVLAVVTAAAYQHSGVPGVINNVCFAAMGPVVFVAGLWARPAYGGAAALAVIVVNEIQQGYLNPFVVAIAAGAWVVGGLLRSRQRLADQLALRGQELDQEREVFAHESVRYERTRIARELHDIVAHCVSVMVVQAAAGQRLLDADPALAAEALQQIAEVADQAQDEMGRLVELLDQGVVGGNNVALDLVDELVARAQATGLDVSGRFVGQTDGLSDRAGEAVYRVVQEAVTNALKHAPGAAIAIDIDGTGDDVEVSVVNGPPAEGVGVLHSLGGSHGLRGMRERVAASLGTIDIGPTPDGGWQVRARLPRAFVAEAH